MGEYKLKFLFANHDGVNVEVTIPETMTVQQLKQDLLDKHWPEEKVEKASGPAGIRLLCMGRMLEDSKTLVDMKIPKYEHPTPVNVSLLPKGKTYSEGTSHGSTTITTKTPFATMATPQQNATRPAAGGGNGGCCTIC